MSTTTERVEDLIFYILSPTVELERSMVKPNMALINDLGADWLDEVELIIGLEEMFDIEIRDDEFERCSTVGDVIQLVEQKL